ncbi:MAG: rhomboid family intramembrane serine protease [Myxococcota bacterium]|nr:rhomboid family intramembrane serine protease [Myxococcota bacterium]
MAARTRESSEAGQGPPWLTCALLLGCVVGFGVQHAAEVDANEAFTRELSQAAEYLWKYPTLEVPAVLEQHVGGRKLAEARVRFEAAQRQRGAPPIPAGVQRRRQAELDARVLTALELRATGPAYGWGLTPNSPTPLRVAGHPFAHASFPHLLTSLALIWILGSALEAGLGTWLVLWVGAGSLAGASTALALFGTGGPFVGAGGLLAGWWGAFLARRAGRVGESRTGSVLAAGFAVLVVPAAIGLELAVPGAGLGSPSPGTWNLSNWPLLGGFAGGVVGALLASWVGLESGLAPCAQGREDSELAAALSRRRAGRREEAFDMLLSLVERDVSVREAGSSLWELAVELGRVESAAPMLLRAVRAAVQAGDVETAVRLWLGLVEADLDGSAETGLLLRMASLLRDAREGEAATRALRAALDRAQSGTAASRIAREASELDADTALEAAWRALGSLDIDLPERQQLEALLAELQPPVEVSPPPAAAAPETPRENVPAPAAAETPGGSAIDFEQTSRQLECFHAILKSRDDDGLLLEMEGGRQRKLRYEQIEAIAVVAVEGLSERPVIVLDLILEWMSLADEPVRLVRLRSDQFDPRRLMPEVQPDHALRALVESLIQQADATPLPDLQSALGFPFAGFKSLDEYQRDVLMVE